MQQQIPLETEKIPLRPDSMCQFEFVDMGYEEALELTRELARIERAPNAHLSVSITGTYGSCDHLSEALDRLTFNVMFGYIQFRDALEIVNMPAMYEFMDTMVRVKTLEGLRYVAFEGIMADFCLADHKSLENVDS